MGQTLQRTLAARRLAPSSQALRTRILCPGDGPPSHSLGTFLDYREIYLPENLTPLSQGIFPLGRAFHPRADAGSNPIFLEWGDLNTHAFVIGPPGSGKTYGVLAPWIVSGAAQGLGVVAVDAKGQGDLFNEVRTARKRLGVSTPLRIHRWDIGEPSTSISWSPLREVTGPDSAAQVAQAFLGEVRSNDSQPYFAERDHRWLRSMVLVVAAALGPMAHPSVLAQLTLDQKYLLTLTRQAPHATYDLGDLLTCPPAEYTTRTAGLANKLSWLGDPHLATMLAPDRHNSRTIRESLAEADIVIIGAPLWLGEKSLAAASLYINLLKLHTFTAFGGHQSHSQIWILDEMPRYGDRIGAADLLDVVRGAGVGVVLGMQNIEQLKAGQGSVASCNTGVILKGASTASAEFFANRLGKISAASLSQAMDHRGIMNPTLSRVDKPLLGDREIMHPPIPGHGGVVHISGRGPYPFLFQL